jgi:thioredoxin-related protein
MQLDPTQAFSQARKEGKKVLLVFSGSDWCIPCIHFEKKVLADSAFKQYASEHLVVLNADFPQRKKVAARLASEYDSLAARFNQEGAFPKIVLLKPDKQWLATLQYSGQSPDAFIRELDKF